MRIEITRSGGFAGLVRTAEVTSSAEAAALAEAVRAAAGRPSDSRVRDGLVYEFVLVTAESRETIEVTAAQLGPLRAEVAGLLP